MKEEDYYIVDNIMAMATIKDKEIEPKSNLSSLSFINKKIVHMRGKIGYTIFGQWMNRCESTSRLTKKIKIGLECRCVVQNAPRIQLRNRNPTYSQFGHMNYQSL